MFDTTLMDMSSHMSCQHMDVMAMDERNKNYVRYVNHFTTNKIDKIDDRPYAQYVHKRICVQGRPQDGDWVNQFDGGVRDPRFDVQTKIR